MIFCIFCNFVFDSYSISLFLPCSCYHPSTIFFRLSLSVVATNSNFGISLFLYFRIFRTQFCHCSALFLLLLLWRRLLLVSLLLYTHPPFAPHKRSGQIYYLFPLALRSTLLFATAAQHLHTDGFRR